MDVFRPIPSDAPLVFATAAWQYTHHVSPGMRTHHGPILTVANWSGQWPGLVGLLNLNGSLVKAGAPFSTLWSEEFTDEFALSGLREWIVLASVTHDLSHVKDCAVSLLPADASRIGKTLADNLKAEKVILGVFDEGCMGMYNAIIDDEQLNQMGFYKERLNQSALFARMRTLATERPAGYAPGSTRRACGSTLEKTRRRSLQPPKLLTSAECTLQLFGWPMNLVAMLSVSTFTRSH